MIHGLFHQPFAGKIIMMETEAMDAVPPREICLTAHDFRVRKVIIARVIQRFMRLIMICE